MQAQQADQKVLRTGMSLKCFCPHCSESLVQQEHIHLEVERTNGETGKLLLSPFFNVFECKSSVGLTEGEEVADLRCTGCGKSLRESVRRCDTCGSAAARLQVQAEEEMVDFFICLRKSCHWHGITEETRSRLILEAAGFHRPDRPRELIRVGTKLQCICPLCSADLVRGDDLIVRVKGPTGEPGELILSPYLSNFKSDCTLKFKRGEVLHDFQCPHCEGSLLVEGKRCELCGAPAAAFRVRTSQGDVELRICVRRGCHWHGLGEAYRDKVELDQA